MIQNTQIVFFLTTSISLFAQVVFVFGFVRLNEPELKNLFKLFFFGNLLFSVSQVSLLMTSIYGGFDFNFFISLNAFFSFFLAAMLLITIKEAELFSKKLIKGGKFK